MNITLVKTEPSTGASRADAWLTPGRFALFLALLIAATFPRVLVGWSTFIIRDFGMFSYPVAHFQRQCFWQGELPLWNPFNNCGVPFLAQWNTMALYPFSLIYLLLPLKWSLSFFCLAHLFWGGLGMYFLAQRWTNQRLAAGLAGVIFAFNGLSLNFLMWPSHVATFSWLPWVVWLGQRAWREGGKLLVCGTLAASMQMLAGGPETIVVTWLILFVLAIGDWLHEAQLRRKLVWRFLGMGVLVALICAVQLLPFLELLAHSQRDTNYSASTHDWCMPFWGWANFLVPLFRSSPTAQGVFLQNGQYWTSSYYAGIGTVLLAAIAVWRVRSWSVRAMAGLVLLGLVLALGDSTPLYRGLRFCFPGLGFVRYPVKFVILVLALAPLLAAVGFAALSDHVRRRERLDRTAGVRPSSGAATSPGDRPSKCSGALGGSDAAAPEDGRAPAQSKSGVTPARCASGRAGLFEISVALLMLLLMGAIVASDWNTAMPEDAWRATWQSGLSRAAFLVLLFLLAAVLLNARGRRRILAGCGLLTLVWLDFVTHTPTQNPGAKPSVYARGWARARLKLDPEPRLGGSRAMLGPDALQFLRYNPLPSLEETYLRNRLAIRVNCNLLDEIPQIDGFFSLVPREVSRVTALPYDHSHQRFPSLLDFLGVTQTTVAGKVGEWVARPSAMPLVTAGQKPVFADDRTAFNALSQTNLDLRQIVFLPPDARGSISATQQTTARVLHASFTNRRISIQAEAPAATMLVISQTYYPAWKASVDGQPARIWRANYAFQALEVPAGRHQIQVTYDDAMLKIGGILSGLGLLVCAVLWWLPGSPRATPSANKRAAVR